MDGFGSHTFSFYNSQNERFYVKFHFKTKQGIQNFTNDEAVDMKAQDPDHAQRDLFEAIERGEFPKWTLKVQIMPFKDAKTYHLNPFDLTKVWPHGDYPLIEVGELELNENPDNYFAHVEQAAFAPAHVVDGIYYSPDKMLQGRILSYPDAQRYRLGGNYEQIPVNRCPYMTNNYQRDGLMTVNGNGGSNPNYFPNSFDDIHADESYKQPAWPLESLMADHYDRNAEGENDHYTQPGNLFPFDGS
jgi:catalase